MAEDKPEVKIESTVVGGTDVGVVARVGGKTVGRAYTEFSPLESQRSGQPVVRGRVEVEPESQGQGIGKKLAEETIRKLEETGGVTHQVAFTEKGQRLEGTYKKQGYQERKDVPEVLEKTYPPRK